MATRTLESCVPARACTPPPPARPRCLCEQVQATSAQLRQFEEAVGAAKQEALDAAQNRHEQLMRAALGRMTQECGAALEEERRQHRTQTSQLQRAMAAEREQAVALLEEQHAQALRPSPPPVLTLPSFERSEACRGPIS